MKTVCNLKGVVVNGTKSKEVFETITLAARVCDECNVG